MSRTASSVDGASEEMMEEALDSAEEASSFLWDVCWLLIPDEGEVGALMTKGSVGDFVDKAKYLPIGDGADVTVRLVLMFGRSVTSISLLSSTGGRRSSYVLPNNGTFAGGPFDTGDLGCSVFTSKNPIKLDTGWTLLSSTVFDRPFRGGDTLRDLLSFRCAIAWLGDILRDLVYF